MLLTYCYHFLHIMKIDLATIDRLAYLAKLSFTDQEKETIKADLEHITGFFAKIAQLPTDGVEPLVYMNAEVNVLRPDVVNALTTHEQALQNAPQANEQFFIVPKVITNP